MDIGLVLLVFGSSFGPQVAFNELFSPRLLPMVEEANGNTESEDNAEKAAEPPISKTAFIYKPIITLGLLLVVLTSIHIILREYLGSKRIKITSHSFFFLQRELEWHADAAYPSMQA